MSASQYLVMKGERQRRREGEEWKEWKKEKEGGKEGGEKELTKEKGRGGERKKRNHNFSIKLLGKNQLDTFLHRSKGYLGRVF